MLIPLLPDFCGASADVTLDPKMTAYADAIRQAIRISRKNWEYPLWVVTGPSG
jgi:hypothetical protein